MNKIATGLILGSVIGIAGVGYMSSSNNAKRKMVKKGKKVVNKAGQALEDISPDMW